MTLLENNGSAFFVATSDFPLLCHKSATTSQIDSNKVSNSKLKLDLFSFIKTDILESTVPPQLPHKRDIISLGHLVSVTKNVQCDIQTHFWRFCF